MNKDYIFIQKKSYAHFFPNVYVIGRVYSFTIAKILEGVTFSDTLTLIKNGVMYWHASEKGLRNASCKGLEIVKDNPNLVSEIRKKFEKIAFQIISFTEKIYKINLEKLAKKDLWKLMSKYLNLYEKIYLYGEPLVLSLNDSLGNYLKKYLEKICSDKKEITNYYNLLISPLEKSFVKKEEDDLLKLALKIKGKKVNKDQLIELHTKKYCWVPYDYGVYIWDEKYFNKTLNRILAVRNIENDLKKSENYFKNLPKKQHELEEKLRIDSYHKKLFKAMRDAAYLLDYKKQVFTLAHYRISKLLEEIGKRFKIDKTLVQYMLPQEVKMFLVSDKNPLKDELKSRYKLSLFHWQNKKVRVILGRKGKLFLKQYLKKQKLTQSTLDGVIASAGKYIGKVRIVKNVQQMNKVKKGDILVTAMTSPDYIVAMRKAGAIITDEGGVMCHAAIVSRELGIPCVVGTKNATKVFKDGNLVEVNANHNSVKIYRK